MIGVDLLLEFPELADPFGASRRCRRLCGRTGGGDAVDGFPQFDLVDRFFEEVQGPEVECPGNRFSRCKNGEDSIGRQPAIGAVVVDDLTAISC